MPSMKCLGLYVLKQSLSNARPVSSFNGALQQLILLVVFGAVDIPLASCMMVQF